MKRDYEVETWAPDFDDVKLDTIVIVEGESRPAYRWNDPDIRQRMKPNDLMRVVALAGRPRVARVEHLRLAEQFHIRVDELLEWHDFGLVMILPG